MPCKTQFEAWREHIPIYLKEFFELFSADVVLLLNYSPGSLDIVEKWILEAYPDTEAMLVSNQSKRVNLLACYIGETFRKALGSEWDINLDDPDDAFYAMPILVTDGDIECPLSLTTASADRRSGLYLRTVLENSL